jgi:hypothetical protein
MQGSEAGNADLRHFALYAFAGRSGDRRWSRKNEVHWIQLLFLFHNFFCLHFSKRYSSLFRAPLSMENSNFACHYLMITVHKGLTYIYLFYVFSFGVAEHPVTAIRCFCDVTTAQLQT